MCKHNKNIGLLIIRLALGAMFLMAGIMKITSLSPEMIASVGGVAHKLDLTFLSLDVWFWIAVVGEILAGLLFVVGFFVPIAALLTIVIMFFAFASLNYDMQMGMPVIIFALTALGLGFTGPGMWSVKGLCCKKCSATAKTCCGSACAPDKKAEMQ